MKLSLLSLLSTACANVITSTLTNTMDERSYAVIDQETYIQHVLLDAAENNAAYESVMQSKGVVFPPELMQFYIELNTYDVTEFPTSLFIASFPFEVFQTFVGNFEWLNSGGFKLPEDYKVVTITEGGKSALPSSTSSTSSLTQEMATMTRSRSLSRSSSLTTSTSSSSTTSSSTTSSISSTTSSISSISSTSHNAAGIITPFIPHFLFLTIMSLLA